MSCTNHADPAPCSCRCLTSDELVRMGIGVVLGIVLAFAISGAPALFVALLALWLVGGVFVLVLELVLAAGARLGASLTRRWSRWRVYAMWTWLALYVGGIVAAIVCGG